MTLIRQCLVLICLSIGFAQPSVADETVPDLTEAQVQKIVKDYLLKNPEVIIEALQIYQDRQELAEEERAKQMLVAHRDRLDDPTGRFVAGNPDGDVTIVEFFDYRCGYCKRVMPDLLDEVARDGNVKLVFKELPVLGEESVRAARAGIAAARQNRYYDMHLAMMQTRGSLSDDRIMSIAADLGLDVEQLKADMGRDEVSTMIQQNRELAHILNIRGTPGFVIGDTLVPGAINAQQFRQIIAETRRAQQG